MAQAAAKSPEEQIRHLEKCAADGDLAAMMQGIGDLHEKWNSLSPDTQEDVKRLEAVFLTLLKVRAAKGATA